MTREDWRIFIQESDGDPLEELDDEFYLGVDVMACLSLLSEDAFAHIQGQHSFIYPCGDPKCCALKFEYEDIDLQYLRCPQGRDGYICLIWPDAPELDIYDAYIAAGNSPIDLPTV